MVNKNNGCNEWRKSEMRGKKREYFEYINGFNWNIPCAFFLIFKCYLIPFCIPFNVENCNLTSITEGNCWLWSTIKKLCICSCGHWIRFSGLLHIKLILFNLSLSIHWSLFFVFYFCINFNSWLYCFFFFLCFVRFQNESATSIWIRWKFIALSSNG